MHKKAPISIIIYNGEVIRKFTPSNSCLFRPIYPDNISIQKKSKNKIVQRKRVSLEDMKKHIVSSASDYDPINLNKDFLAETQSEKHAIRERIRETVIYFSKKVDANNTLASTKIPFK